ncbi:hypothetical protein Tco_1376788 [Tanacetum coccineum]
MHKEDQQATCGPTSLGVTSEAGANPQLRNGNDALTVSTAEADPRNSTPSDFVPQQQVKEEEDSSTIKLEDLAKLVSHVQPRFKDLDLPEDDPVIVVDDSDEKEDDEIHTTENVLILQSQKHKLKLEKNKAEAEVALLKAQAFFPNVEQLNELLVKSLKPEFSNILSALDFSSSLPTELKDLPSKFDELTEEVASVQAKLKTLDALPGLLLNVTKALNKFAQVLDSASLKAGGQSVPSTCQADTGPAEGEKDTNQATISHLFQRRAEKDNINKTSHKLKQHHNLFP